MPTKITVSHTKPHGSSRFRKRIWERVGRALYGDALYERYPWEDEIVYVSAHEGRSLVGFAHLWIEGGVVFVEELLVHDRHRGRGVGKALMKKIERVAHDRKAHKISLDTDPELEPANRFYKSLGFKKEATLPRHYGKRPTVVYGKRLD